MRMVKFHHRAAAAVAPATTLADLMGTTTYVIHGDDGEVPPFDSALIDPWGPFTAVSGPTSDQDGWLGTYRTVNFNGTSQSLLHSTTNLVTPEDDYVLVMAFQLVANATHRTLFSFATSSTEQHAAEVASDDNWYFRNAGGYLYSAVGTFPEGVPVILVYSRSESAGQLRGKFYVNGATDYHAVALASAGMGASAAHTIGKRANQAFGYCPMRLRFAALSVNQGALDESGMDALSTFLQSGPYNCPLS